jgi:alpha-N-arabinofuranosidase
MLGVGNEQWGPQYFERYERFATALRAQHPEIKLVAGAGPSPADDRFNLAWTRLRELKADIVDEHCYDKPAWFLDHANRYDQYDRKGPKVFMGEYAAQSVQTVSPDNRNDWGCALAEAAYMTGLERNADVVVMSSYAPLLAHVDGWQWTPDLIWFDNLRAFASPSYYVQQLFSRNRGDVVLPAHLTGAGSVPRLYASASRDQAHGEIILKFVNASGEDQRVSVKLAGAARVRGKARMTVLTAAELAQENTLDHPLRVAPQTRSVNVPGPQFEQTFRRYSVTVLRINAP